MKYFLSFFLFAFFPSTILVASTTPPIQEFFLFTMPKTGTFLLAPLLENITGRMQLWYSPGEYIRDKDLLDDLLENPEIVQFYWIKQPLLIKTLAGKFNDLASKNYFIFSHAAYSERLEEFLMRRNALVFIVIRDPRDYVISLINHRLGDPGSNFFIEPEFQALSFEDKITQIIKGTDWYNSTHTVVNRFYTWRHSSICCPLRFEAILGPHGGAATETEQLAELRKITSALRLHISDDKLLEAFKNSYGQGLTFHKAQVGIWKEHFTEEHKALFKGLCGDLLIELGYEENYDW